MRAVHVATANDRVGEQLKQLSGHHAFEVVRQNDVAVLAALPQTAVIVVDESLIQEDTPAGRSLLSHPKLVLISERDVEGTVEAS